MKSSASPDQVHEQTMRWGQPCRGIASMYLYHAIKLKLMAAEFR
jgi:hypothetical protein